MYLGKIVNGASKTKQSVRRQSALKNALFTLTVQCLTVKKKEKQWKAKIVQKRGPHHLENALYT